MEIYVQQVWRYPVKSIAGESLERADVLPLLVATDGAIRNRLPSHSRSANGQAVADRRGRNPVGLAARALRHEDVSSRHVRQDVDVCATSATASAASSR